MRVHSPSSVPRPARAAFPLLVVLAACEIQPAIIDTKDVARDALWSVRTAGQSTHFGWLALGPVNSVDPMIAAMQSATGVGISSTACIKRSAESANTVRLTFDNCAAPFGITQLTGELVVVFSAGEGGALHAELSVEKWSAYGFAATFLASADMTISGGARTVKWQSSWSASTPDGTIGSVAGLTLSFDSSTACRTLDGGVNVTWGARVTDSTLAQFRFCANGATADSCPNGSATHIATYSGESMSTLFGGTPAFTGTDVLGHSYAASFACTR